MYNTSKENILKRIRKALSNPTPIPFPGREGSESVYVAPTQETAIEFAEKFSRLQGRFAYCIDREELASQLHHLVRGMEWKKVFCLEPALLPPLADDLQASLVTTGLADCDVSITGCEYLVARTGSIVMSAAQASGRNSSVYAPIHICIAGTSQLVTDVKDALQGMKERYPGKMPSLITFATGPSRTADIEKTLVVGVHGPKEVYVFLLEDNA